MAAAKKNYFSYNCTTEGARVLAAFSEMEESGMDLPTAGEKSFGGGETASYGTVFADYFGDQVPKWVKVVYELSVIEGSTQSVYESHLEFIWDGEYVYGSKWVGEKFDEEGGKVGFKMKPNPLPLQKKLDEGEVSPVFFAEEAEELGWFTSYSLKFAPSDLVGKILRDNRSRKFVDVLSGRDRSDLLPDDRFDLYHLPHEKAACVTAGASLSVERLLVIIDGQWVEKYFRPHTISITDYVSVMEAAEAAGIETSMLNEAAEALRKHAVLRPSENPRALAPRFKRWGGGFSAKDAKPKIGSHSRTPLCFTDIEDFAAFELFEDREAAIAEAFRGGSSNNCLLAYRRWRGYDEVCKMLRRNPYPSYSGRGDPLAVPCSGFDRATIKEAVRRDGRCFRIHVDCDVEGESKDGKPIPIDNLSKWLFGVPGQKGHIWVGEHGIYLPEATPQECIDLLKEVVARL